MKFGHKPFAANARVDCITLVLDPKAPTEAFRVVDGATGGRLTRALESGDLGTQPGRSLMVHAPDGIRSPRVLLVATGDKPPSVADWQRIVESIATRLAESKAASALIDLAAVADGEIGAYRAARSMMVALAHRVYRFHGTRRAGVETPSIRRVDICGPEPATVRRAARDAAALAAGLDTARNLGNLPGNLLGPEEMAREARRIARGNPRMTVRVLGEKQMQDLGMGALLAVSQGSERGARLIAVEYRGAAKSRPPIALVGKGITFDTGGISLKPPPAMDEMKFDMCGAAAVLGALVVAAELALPINLVAVVAAAENMPDGRATRPGDVVTTMSGQTVEILNTDAEGRLVLCDALTWVARYKPEVIIDVATLTGACIVALGSPASGLFSTDDELAAALLDAGEFARDRAWRLPVWDDYQQNLRSNFADMANVGGREAGSTVAACFLSRFVKDQRWAHLDVAGTAFAGGAAKGATGRPVALLSQYLMDRAGHGR